MRLVLLVAAVALAGCGGRDFSGTYFGTLAGTISCSDGSGGPDSVSAEWAVTDSGDRVSLAVNGACGIVDADADGDVLVLYPKSCGSSSQNGTTTAVSLTGGTLTFGQDAVSVSIGGSVYLTGAILATCTATHSGTLTKR